jgi:aspartate/methionine/tyrosine aminotransferase
MNPPIKRSDYMEWAKTCSMARFNLATSGLANISIRDFPIHQPEMEITGPGGYGYRPLQESMAHHTRAPVECVVAATGASMANYLAMSATLNPGDEVLIERPGYGLFADVAGYLGARISFFDRLLSRDFVADPTAIAARLTSSTRLIVLSNLHNPSGALISEQTLREIGELALRNRAHVLVDEVYLPMLFDVDPPSAFTIGRVFDVNPFIVTSSLTKTYGLSGLRCGWIVAESHLAHRMWRLNDLFGVNAAHVAEQMSVNAFDRLGELQAHARSLLTTNRKLLLQFLDANPGLECYRPPAGTVALPKLQHGDPEKFLKLLRNKYETTVVPGRFFGAPQHFRIGIGDTAEMVRDGLEQLGAALAEFAGA